MKKCKAENEIMCLEVYVWVPVMLVRRLRLPQNRPPSLCCALDQVLCEVFPKGNLPYEVV